MKRSAIKEEEKWDLTKFYSNYEEYKTDYNLLKQMSEKVLSFKGKIMDSAKSLLEFLNFDTEMSMIHEKIYCYSYLYHYSDMNDSFGQKLKEQADRITDEITEKTSFERSEILSVPYTKVLEYIKENKELEPYSFMLEQLFRFEEHTLSTKEEEIISLASSALGVGDNAFSALDNADAEFGTIIVDGKEEVLNHSNYSLFMCHKDREVRKNAFLQHYKFYQKHRNTLAEMYKGQIKEDSFYTKVHKFNSSLERSLYNDAISCDVYTNLINTLHNNVKPLHEYMKFRKDFLGYEELHNYDLFVDLLPEYTKKFSFEEARDYVLNAVKPLGDTYVKDLTKLFDSRCIDIFHNDGKRSGAYQTGFYRIDPYVSINFEGNEDSVSTLAHELGHAMHSYYADQNQSYIYAQYPIFLAEIASTVNEILLNDYMIKNAKNDEEKLLYLIAFLDKFRATVYVQTMFAEFELKAHELDEKGESLTVDALDDIFFNLSFLYNGESVTIDNEVRSGWSRIPHFYSSFYVYKYATGFCAALAIAHDILNEVDGAKERYLKFLSSGGSNYPLNTLKECGVDMTSSTPILKGIEMFSKNLEEVKKLVKKVK